MADETTNDLSLLGRSEASLPQAPSRDILESFPNPKPGRHYQITLDCPEFSSLCPVTGQPDTAHVEIRYAPADLCIETKSLKFYLASYRNHEAFNEAVTNRLLDDLVAVCAPREMSVRARFGSRGGIRLTVVANHPDAGRTA